jgi:hypothetical protein
MIDNANPLAGILHNRPLPARVRAEVLRSRGRRARLRA